jgi:hypothetical protein
MCCSSQGQCVVSNQFAQVFYHQMRATPSTMPCFPAGWSSPGRSQTCDLASLAVPAASISTSASDLRCAHDSRGPACRRRRLSPNFTSQAISERTISQGLPNRSHLSVPRPARRRGSLIEDSDLVADAVADRRNVQLFPLSEECRSARFICRAAPLTSASEIKSSPPAHRPHRSRTFPRQ